MELVLKFTILIALVPLFKAQQKDQEKTFTVSNDQNTIFPSEGSLIGSTSWPAVENQEHENNQILVTTEEPGTTTIYPSLRCLSCKFCSPNEGKTRDSKGKKFCPIHPGVLNGCSSIYFNFSSSAGGPEGYIIRSCISDLSEGDHNYCKINERVCHKCYSDDCNYLDITTNGLVTGGGARIMVSMFLVIPSLIGWILGIV
ncbi:uncharacterized protein LOC123037695 [Drosophila rhopaloa]|uniref:Uncharacterized protein n=1 Tax=Drosophila rhopaloa TaxID=1041015 RepID=A0ABM5J947_DRORH|nr:uncharacterized protein LOC123037695 [Drosophila rhopaloa]